MRLLSEFAIPEKVHKEFLEALDLFPSCSVRRFIREIKITVSFESGLSKDFSIYLPSRPYMGGLPNRFEYVAQELRSHFSKYDGAKTLEELQEQFPGL